MLYILKKFLFYKLLLKIRFYKNSMDPNMTLISLTMVQFGFEHFKRLDKID
jgi:hypothetical protein